MHNLSNMKMRRRLAAAVFLAMAPMASAGPREPVLPQDGTYLSLAYIAALEKTKSHFAAAYKAAAPQAVIVSRNQQGEVELNAVVGWYETALSVYDSKNPAVFEDPDSGEKKPFTWIDATNFKIGRGKNQSAYRFVGNEQEFLIGRLLAGTYADARGRKYVFAAGGKAEFPGRTFTFEILTNILDESWDQIVENTGDNQTDRSTIAFAWRGATLFLYNCNTGSTAGCTPDRKHPIAVLHKLR